MGEATVPVGASAKSFALAATGNTEAEALNTSDHRHKTEPGNPSGCRMMYRTLVRCLFVDPLL